MKVADLQKRLNVKKELPPYAFSVSAAEISPATRRMVKEALTLAKAGNFTGAVDTAFTAGYTAACLEIANEIEKAFEELLPDVYAARRKKKGGGKNDPRGIFLRRLRCGGRG